jgi:puromycin-sensitive aminopeptidase
MNYNLDNKFIPHHYDLVLFLKHNSDNIFTNEFNGVVCIRCELNKINNTAAPNNNNIIRIHARDIQLNKVKYQTIVNGEISNEFTLNEWTYHEQLQMYEIKLNKNDIPYRFFDLIIAYKGKIQDNLHGMYKSYEKNGAPQFNLITQFESTFARYVFPCFDEPALKATFRLMVSGVPPGWVTRSNQLVEKYYPELNLYKFHITQRMSTYLLALYVGDFGFRQDRYLRQKKNSYTESNSGVEVSIYAPKDELVKTKFALNTSIGCLKFFENYFGIDYPLPKLDLIGLADFGSGAMENWGLITFRKAGLLFNEKTSPLKTKVRIATVIAHEIAHQWFGNLVTMGGWDELWLNESFASWAEVLCIHSMFPEWNIWYSFLADDTTNAWDLDQLSATHPIKTKVTNPNEIDHLFDEISYEKGSFIIYQLHNYVGDQVFRKALNLYMRTHAYSNALSNDLWDAFDEILKENKFDISTNENKKESHSIRRMMNSWIDQKGIPIIFVEKYYSKNEFQLKQKVFNGVSEARWIIPLYAKTDMETKKELADFSEDHDIDLDRHYILKIQSDSFIKLNYQMKSYHFTHYEPSLFDALIDSLDMLSHEDIIGLSYEIFTLHVYEHYSNEQLLKFIKHMNNYFTSQDKIIYQELSSYTIKMSKLFSLVGYHHEFARSHLQMIKKIFVDLYKKSFNESNDYNYVQLVNLLISLMGYLGDDLLDKKSNTIYEYLLHNRNKISEPISHYLTYFTKRTLDEKIIDRLLLMIDDPDYNYDIMKALANVQNSNLLEKVLRATLNEKLRLQDKNIFFAHAELNPYARVTFKKLFSDSVFIDQLVSSTEVNPRIFVKTFHSILVHQTSDQASSFIDALSSRQINDGVDKINSDALNELKLELPIILAEIALNTQYETLYNQLIKIKN